MTMNGIVGRSILRYARISPKKMKLIMDLIRGKPVPEAMWILRFTNKKGARIAEKVLKAAVDSYRQKVPDFEESRLVVSLAKVDRGPILKRVRPAWRGRAVLVRKRTAHVTIEVTERE